MTPEPDNEIGIRGLSTSQLVALPLLVSGMSYADAASKAGVSHGTLRNWCSQHDEFKAALAQLRREAHGHALASIHALASDATAALRAILTDDMAMPRDKLTAAQTVLRHVMPTQSQHVLLSPDDAAGAIAQIVDSLESDQ